MVPHLSTHHSAQPHNKHSTCSSVSFLILCFCAFSSSMLSSTPSMSYVHAHKDGQYISARIVKPHHFLPYTCIHICIYSRTQCVVCAHVAYTPLHRPLRTSNGTRNTHTFSFSSSSFCRVAIELSSAAIDAASFLTFAVAKEKHP